MIKDVQFISIKEIVSRLLRHPLLQTLDLEQATQYTVDFLHIMGMEDMYESKEADVEIKDYRGELPCDLLEVIQVKNKKTQVCLRSTTSSFNEKNIPRKFQRPEYREHTFKTQNRVIFTSFPHGIITVAYKAIAVDDEGYPLVIDNSVFLKALELYIKREVFTILFDCGKVSPQAFNNVQQQYAWYVGKCEAEFSTPSISEMEGIKNMWTTLIQRTVDFDNGFRHLGTREYIRRH